MPRVSASLIRTGVRLPNSSPRNIRGTFLKLLSRVDPDAATGFGFEGRLLRAGALVARSELRPSLDYPPTPIVLEYGASCRTAGHAYVLWRFDGQAWVEIARAYARSWEWAIDLRPIAVRALAAAHGNGDAVAHALVRAVPVDEVLARISTMITAELGRLDSDARVRLLSALHDELACRICA